MSYKTQQKQLSIPLSFIFFISGASALIFESVWFHQAGLNLGNSVWASSIVLASFMAGLAIGNAFIAVWGEKIHFALRFYVCLEVIIAIFGITTIILFSKSISYLTPLYSSMTSQPLLLNFIRIVIAFSFMLIPTIAMGMTLPLLVKALYKQTSNFGETLGLLYGWNTLGALTGVLLNELIIIKFVGIWGAGFFAASLNILAAFFTICLIKQESTLPSNIKTSSSTLIRQLIQLNKPLTGSFLAGAILLALEVIWFRFILLFFNSHSWNFAVMLATVLAGIGTGGLFASKWSRKNSNFHEYLFYLFIINGLLVIILYGNFSLVLFIFQKIRVDRFIFVASFFLIFPIAFISGAIFTAIGSTFHNENLSESRATSFLTMANTTGAMLGAVVGGYILLPLLGTEIAFFIIAVAYGLTCLLFRDGHAKILIIKNLNAAQVLGTIFIISLFTFPFGLMERSYINIASELYADLTGEKRIAWREGVTETIQYMKKDIADKAHYYRLITNNYSMSATSKDAKRYMKFFVYWPVTLLGNPKNALLICFGCGSTAKALTDTKSLEEIDIVDISRDILEMSNIVYPIAADNPTKDKRVNLHVEDGRFFLQTTEKKFDIITAEPPPPSFYGVVNLYTQEYFHLIRNCLNLGGIATYWLPVYQLRPNDTKAIIKAFCNEFSDCSLWSGGGLEWMLAGTNNYTQPVSEKLFQQQWQDEKIGHELKKLGFVSPEQFGASFVADGSRLKQWVGSTKPLVDDFPQRLSPVNRTWQNGVPVYRDFMNSKKSYKNFMHSKNIAKYWPQSIKNASKNFFSSRWVVDDLLMTQGTTKYSQLYVLHQCIHNPLLNKYIPWALGSDYDAIEIMKSIIATVPEKDWDIANMKKHLVAMAVMSKNYSLAERLLSTDSEAASNEQKWTEFMLRIYLLLLVNDDEKVARLSKHYLETCDNPNAVKSKIIKIINLSKEAIHSGQISLWRH